MASFTGTYKDELIATANVDTGVESTARRATPWLSQSKQGGGAPPAASLYYSLYVNAPTPSRCRGDHFAKHDGPN